MTCCAGSAEFKSNLGNMPKVMQIARLPPGNKSYIIPVLVQIRNIFALKDLEIIK